MIDTAFFITSFVTLFVIIDPIGLTPLFVALTQGMSVKQRRAIAIRATLVSAGILALFAIFGEALLGFIGISMAAFKIAGGILLLLTALDMLFQRRTKRREDTAEEDDDLDDPSVFPLAIPLIAGPGSIATVILLAGAHPGFSGLGLSLAVMVLVLLVTFIFFEAATPLERLLGKTGINVVSRLLGMLLAALAVQFMLNGLRDFGLLGIAPT
ncbi:MAG: MarC family protein [Planktotalea sp.]|uniref:MarC family protein n=1 Tax=Planktotalea sp. TaxID=2029877 RepID=UPI0026345873|nr:MarC family protein [Planktotalea sp.]MDG1084473.1 MarC family protein [Planktotalea sp.]